MRKCRTLYVICTVFFFKFSLLHTYFSFINLVAVVVVYIDVLTSRTRRKVRDNAVKVTAVLLKYFQ